MKDMLREAASVAERVSVHRDLPRVGMVDAGENLDERGLSGAVGTEEGEDAAGVDVEVDLGQGEGAAEPLGSPRMRTRGSASKGAVAFADGSGASCTDISGGRPGGFCPMVEGILAEQITSFQTILFAVAWL